MEQAQMYQTISLVGFAAGGVFLIAAVILFIRLKIAAVVGELTGRTARKQIEAYREGTGDMESAVPQKKKKEKKNRQKPEIIDKKDIEESTSILPAEEDTAVLEEETAILEQEEGTEILNTSEDTDFQIVKEEISAASKETI